jgi:hypothetical protein
MIVIKVRSRLLAIRHALEAELLVASPDSAAGGCDMMQCVVRTSGFRSALNLTLTQVHTLQFGKAASTIDLFAYSITFKMETAVASAYFGNKVDVA